MARAQRPTAASMLLLCLTPCVLLVTACTSLPVHNINVLGGSRRLDESAWSPVDDQRVFGIEVDTYKPGVGIGAELGLQRARDTGTADIPNQGQADVEGESLELYAGGRKTFPMFRDHLFPYVGMGLAYVMTDFDVSLPSGSTSDGGDSLGVYIRGGAYWNFAGNWHVGLDLRRLIGTEVDILGVESDADYFQMALFVGFAF